MGLLHRGKVFRKQKRGSELNLADTQRVLSPSSCPSGLGGWQGGKPDSEYLRGFRLTLQVGQNL